MQKSYVLKVKKKKTNKHECVCIKEMSKVFLSNKLTIMIMWVCFDEHVTNRIEPKKNFSFKHLKYDNINYINCSLALKLYKLLMKFSFIDSIWIWIWWYQRDNWCQQFWDKPHKQSNLMLLIRLWTEKPFPLCLMPSHSSSSLRLLEFCQLVEHQS